VRVLSIGLIDEPELATRESMDDQKLESLAGSIRKYGLFNPISVEQRGARYRIMAGHRRFVAHKMNGATSIECKVWPEGTEHAIAIQAGENDEREKINPAEQGSWYEELLASKCGDDVAALCELVGKPFEYVSSRLLLTRGDPGVLAAVKAKEINLTVATELNKIPADDLRRYYLENAIAHGVSGRVAKQWRIQAEDIARSRQSAPVDEPAAGEAAHAGPVVQEACICCGKTTDLIEMRYVRVHHYCQKAILEPALERRRDTA
jgi:ParB family chromosome partitioning protein